MVKPCPLAQVLGHPVGAKILQAASGPPQILGAGAPSPHIHQAARQPTASINVLLQHLRREREAGPAAAEMAVETALKDAAFTHTQVQSLKSSSEHLGVRRGVSWCMGK